MLGFIRRFADQKLIRELAEVRADLEAAQRRESVMQAEIDTQAATIIRDRERVKAETAIAVAKRAKAEGKAEDAKRN